MVIIITGSMNAGKTTVAKLLLTKLPRTAHIEKLRQFIEWMSIEESIPYNIDNIISLSENFIRRWNLNVVISYPFSDQSFELFHKKITPLDVPIYAFTLSPSLAVAISNRGKRELKNWEIAQIKKTYEQGFHCPHYGTILDTTHQTPEQTVEMILAMLPIPS